MSGLDSGSPFYVIGPSDERGLVLFTSVCPRRRCPMLHLDAVEADRGSVVDTRETPRDALRIGLDVGTRELRAAESEAVAYLASERSAALRAWVEENEARWRLRHENLRGQAWGSPPDARPAPRWKPAERLYHHELYPYHFVEMLRYGDEPWLINDACCVDPACNCEQSALVFWGRDDQHVEVTGVLGVRRPESAKGLARALWEAVHEDEALIDRLRQRRAEIREAGPFIVGDAFENARLASGKSAPASSEAGGYLQGGAIPVALVRRLFEATAALYAERKAVAVTWWSWFHVALEGAITREAWAGLLEDPWSICLHEALDAETPWLDFGVGRRAELTEEHRRQRMALGLPLIAGALLPVVLSIAPGDVPNAPSAGDVRIAIAVTEALLAATPELHPGDIDKPWVFERRIELDTGAVDVRLTASHPDASWTPDEHEHGDVLAGEHAHDEECDDEEEDDLGDGEDDHDEEPHEDLVETPLEAFTDAALARGLSPDLVQAASTLLDGLGEYAAEFPNGRPWFDEFTATRFLEDYAPREVMLTEAEIERTPAALRAFADWLGEMGYGGAGRFRSAVDRSSRAFQKRARDPRQFGKVKALFVEMRDAGVDISDQEAIDRYLAAKNATPSPAQQAPAPGTRAPTRWQPAPGERAPAPKDPCGCGSGRRYKKCCMPR